MAPGPPNLGNNRFASLASDSHPKRKKPSYTPLNFPELPHSRKDNPKFITISATDTNKPISKYSCFAVHKALEAISKEIVSISELRAGNLLLLVKNHQIAQKFISTKKLPGVCEIEVKYHESLNSVKGTIYAPCLNNVSEKEIIENLSKQGVVGVYKFAKKIEGVSQFTGIVLLTFDLYELPGKVEVSWRSARVKPYYPNPMRCKVCQRLGHTAKRCNNTPVCDSCNFPSHSTPCSRIFCANCSGDHPASANTCPKYTQMKDILKIKCQNKCSMREALNLYKAQIPSVLNIPFAEVAKEAQKPKTKSTQPISKPSLPSPIVSSNKPSINPSFAIPSRNSPQIISAIPSNSQQSNNNQQSNIELAASPLTTDLHLNTHLNSETTFPIITTQATSYNNQVKQVTQMKKTTATSGSNLCSTPNTTEDTENNTKEDPMLIDNGY